MRRSVHGLHGITAWFLLFPSTALLAQPLELDAGFQPEVTRDGAAVYATAQSDGKVVVGGEFARIGGVNRSGIARLNGDGSVDTTFNPGNGVLGGIVTDMALQSDRKILIAGSFKAIDGVQRIRVARLNADGTLDATFDPGTGPNNRVNAVGLQSDGKVVIAGAFLEVAAVSRVRVARLNPDGTLDPSFDPGSGVTDPAFGATVNVLDLAVQDDGKILIGGVFAQVNGVARGGIARLNEDGSLDPSFGPPSGITGSFKTIYALALQPDGRIVVGGGFASVNGVSRKNIARLHATGSTDTSFNPGAGPDFRIWSVAVQSDGKIVIGGEFSTFAGTGRAQVARLNDNGGLDASFDSGTTVRGSVYSISFQSDGSIILGKVFSPSIGAIQSSVERLGTDGSTDTSFDHGGGLRVGFIQAAAVQTDGKVVIGGDFDAVNGRARKRVARVNTDGSVDTEFDVGGGATGSIGRVYAVALQTDAKVIIGGGFTTVNGVNRARVARLNSDGSLDTSFDPGTGPSSRVLALALQTDGKVVVGGEFTTVQGTSRNYVARLNGDGSLDTGFTTGTGPIAAVQCIALQNDGKIVIGGRFGSVNGAARDGMARLNADGSLDTGFVPVATGITYVNAAAVDGNGRVVFGGYFYAVGGDTSWYTLLRLNSIGGLDVKLSTGAPFSEMMNALAVQSDGRTVFGGGFISASEVGGNRMGRLNDDGSVENLLAPGAGILDQVNAVAVHADGSIFLAGDFSSVNGQPRFALARLASQSAPKLRMHSPLRLDAGTFQFALDGPAGQTCRIDVSSDTATWTLLTNVAISGASTIIRDSAATGPARFYRATSP